MDTRLDHDRAVACRRVQTSPDGYIRLLLGDLSALRFIHLFSHVDPELRDELQVRTAPVHSAGYSEWKSETGPVISLGWGWLIRDPRGYIALAPGGVRSNVMLVDPLGYDLGPSKTSELLSGWLCELGWQDSVNRALCNEAACHF